MLKSLAIALLWLGVLVSAQAHHVLGRPAYSLNEDSNTPPSMQVETQIGNYFVNYMVFPAFPRPNEPGRINFYASHIDSGQSLTSEVTFMVRDDSWFASAEEFLGKQLPDDRVYRQGFVFNVDGEYLITAKFEANGEPYSIDFPLRIGAPTSLLGPLALSLGVILSALVTVNIVKHRQLQRTRIRSTRKEA